MSTSVSITRRIVKSWIPWVQDPKFLFSNQIWDHLKQLYKAMHAVIYNTYTALILANCSFVPPLSIWMLHSYLESIPVDLEDAARIDGCTRLGAISRVTVPLMVPSYIAIGTWQFLWLTCTPAARSVVITSGLGFNSAASISGVMP
jgi:ABC-type sulfate transport system permease component